ncbi:MAG: hypothetical protein JWO36_5011 [Myxococcales bacterium]|nr:hypothetical protein [Myxococcales bacterium]
MHRAALTWFGLAACSSTSSPTATVAPFHYELYAHHAEPQGPPASPVAPVIYYDSMPIERLAIDYPNYADAIGMQHTVELRYGTIVLASLARTIGVQDNAEACSEKHMNAPLTTYSETLCEYDNGEFRIEFADAATADGGGCLGDAFCPPRCGTSATYTGCPTGTHCTSRVTSVDPFASYLDCAPIGNKQLGDACTLIADPAGAYDDCADQLLCASGTCQALCSDACASCDYVPGHAPELRICN